MALTLDSFSRELERLQKNPAITVLHVTQPIAIEGDPDGWIVSATFDPADRWNGWIGNPRVNRANAEIIAANAADGETIRIEFDGDVLVVVQDDWVDRISPDEDGLYNVGLGWVWYEVRR